MDEAQQKYLAELREWFKACQDYYQDELTASLGGASATTDSGNHGPPPPPPQKQLTQPGTD